MPRPEDHAVKRDQHGPKAKGDNITWADVIVLQRQLQQSLGKRVDIHICSGEYAGEEDYTRVEVRAFTWERPWERPAHKVSALWETRNVATMTGLLVRLLHQLDHVCWHAAQQEQEGRAH